MYNMKKILNYLLIAATVCGISLAAASCSSNDDNPCLRISTGNPC